MTGPKPEATGVAVAAFLRANPDWLAGQDGLYGALAPPRRVHGDILTDHMAAMLHAARAQAGALARDADAALAAGRAAAGLSERVQEAVLGLLRSTDPADFVAHALAPMLGLDAACLCQETTSAALLPPGWRGLPPGMVGRLLGGRPVRVRSAPDDALLLHAEAAGLAAGDALASVPATPAPALLALLARDPHCLPPPAAEAALSFLGRAIGAALQRA